MRAFIFGDESDTSTWRVYIPAHCLILSLHENHLVVELDNADQSSTKIRDVEVPISIVQKARRVIDVQKELDTHLGWARATIA